MRRSRVVVTVMGLMMLSAAASLAPVSATPSKTKTASVKIVDHYRHGKITVTINDVKHVVNGGEVVKPFAVTPAPSGNDVIQISANRYAGCGTADASRYFAAGKSYRLIITTAKPGGCLEPSGKKPAPRFTVKPVRR